MESKNRFMEPVAFAGWILDDEIRYHSSSGGVFTSLARFMLKNGGVVYGAAYAEDLSVCHVRIDSEDQLYKLRGSKYIQSRIQDIYKEVVRDLENEVNVLFSGTPCQTAAMNNIVTDKVLRDRLVTVDVLCHGVPSVLAWESYLDEVRSKTGLDIVAVNMRDKSRGWAEGCVRLSLSNGEDYVESYRKGIWGPAFFTNLFLRGSCYNCHFKKKIRRADFTLGDFWAACREEEFKKYDDNDKGTSIILINSLKGQDYIQKINDCYFESIPYECLLKGQYVLYKSSSRNYFRTWAFESLGKIPFSQIVNASVHPSLLKKVRARVWRVAHKNGDNQKVIFEDDIEAKFANQNKDQSKLNTGNQPDTEKPLPKLFELSEDCCGCGACYSTCPTQAISMLPDQEGFLYPVNDAEKCLRCYACVEICPIKGK